MNPNEVELRKLLIDIGNKLSNPDRASLTFLLGDDVPRRDLDTISNDPRASMNIIWDALIDRRKITPDNVDYLIGVMEAIRRMDLAGLLRQYSGAPKAASQVEEPRSASELFTRINP